MPRPAVIIIESSPNEAVLACAAVALRPEVRVLKAGDLGSAAELLAQGPIALAILGSEAIGAADGALLQAFTRGGVPVVGICADIPEAVRERALAAGVRELYERPREWQAYCTLIAALLDRAPPTRTG